MQGMMLNYRGDFQVEYLMIKLINLYNLLVYSNLIFNVFVIYILKIAVRSSPVECIAFVLAVRLVAWS